MSTGQSTTRRLGALTQAVFDIVVVGGGFSGAMSAVNIARRSDHPLHVVVVNDRGSVGRGVAYGLRRPEYLLNVAARNMSAFPDEPDHFTLADLEIDVPQRPEALMLVPVRAEGMPQPLDDGLLERRRPRRLVGDRVLLAQSPDADGNGVR